MPSPSPTPTSLSALTPATPPNWIVTGTVTYSNPRLQSASGIWHKSFRLDDPTASRRVVIFSEGATRALDPHIHPGTNLTISAAPGAYVARNNHASVDIRVNHPDAILVHPPSPPPSTPPHPIRINGCLFAQYPPTFPTHSPVTPLRHQSRLRPTPTLPPRRLFPPQSQPAPIPTTTPLTPPRSSTSQFPAQSPPAPLPPTYPTSPPTQTPSPVPPAAAATATAAAAAAAAPSQAPSSPFPPPTAPRPSSPLSHLPIPPVSHARTRQPGELCETIGIVSSISSLREIPSPAPHSATPQRWISLLDESGPSIDISLLHDEAVELLTEEDRDRYPVLWVRNGIRKRHYERDFILVDITTEYSVDPDAPEAKRLRTWFDDTRRQALSAALEEDQAIVEDVTQPHAATQSTPHSPQPDEAPASADGTENDTRRRREEFTDAPPAMRGYSDRNEGNLRDNERSTAAGGLLAATSGADPGSSRAVVCGRSAPTAGTDEDVADSTVRDIGARHEDTAPKEDGEDTGEIDDLEFPTEELCPEEQDLGRSELRNERGAENRGGALTADVGEGDSTVKPDNEEDCGDAELDAVEPNSSGGRDATGEAHRLKQAAGPGSDGIGAAEENQAGSRAARVGRVRQTRPLPARPSYPTVRPSGRKNPAVRASHTGYPGVQPSPMPGTSTLGYEGLQGPPASTLAVSAAIRTGTEKKYTVFIGHGGPDKFKVAVPLHKALTEAGVSAFVDVEELAPGDHLPTRISKEAESADVGVFILSPEFFARKWTMIELQAFLGRVSRAQAEGGQAPVIIPVFHRWSVQDCSNQKFYKGRSVRDVFMDDGFFDPERQEIFSTREVYTYMRSLKAFAGVEANSAASSSWQSFLWQVSPVQKILKAVLQVVKPNG